MPGIRMDRTAKTPSTQRSDRKGAGWMCGRLEVRRHPHYHTTTLPHYHTTTLPHYHTTTLPHYHTPTLPHCHTATLPHCYTHPFSLGDLGVLPVEFPFAWVAPCSCWRSSWTAVSSWRSRLARLSSGVFSTSMSGRTP